MKIECDIIMDLLPLYYDGVCNESSKKMIEEHLKECKNCQEALEKMKNNTVDRVLKNEREHVVKNHTQTIKRNTTMIGASIAACMSIPILVTFIINLATGRALDWFFIVLTSLMTAASVTVVPLVVNKNKWLITFLSFTASLTLLLLTCVIFTRGDWFFVTIVPIYFGLSLIFLPYLLIKLGIKRHKGLIYMLINTFFLYGVIVVSMVYVGSFASFGNSALTILVLPLALVWAMFLVAKYLRVNGFIKAGICIALAGAVQPFISGFVERVLGYDGRLIRIFDANLLKWNTSHAINSNIDLLIFISCLAMGIILFVIGATRKKKSV
ncbi:MAG: zf-HC2 domain-containing protein [Defluviitaleaceae bacterium]|nr:zf-HC2 domain-containing protein [Defluviitaleaceae bacterium]